MFGSSGVASASHLEVERMRAAAKIKLTHVPYRGAPEAIADTAAGRVDFVIAPLASGRAFMDNKQLIAIASTAKKRSPLIPDVPTITETGLKMRMGAWVGLFGPKGMPADLVQKIHAATVARAAMPEANAGSRDRRRRDAAVAGRVQEADLRRNRREQGIARRGAGRGEEEAS